MLRLYFPWLTLTTLRRGNPAFIKFTATSDRIKVQVRSYIAVQADHNPPSWHCEPEANFFTRRANCIASTAWDEIEKWYEDQVYYSPDIKALLQALINQPTWQPYQNASFFWEDCAQRSDWKPLNERIAYSFYRVPLKAPELSVHYNHWKVKEVT